MGAETSRLELGIFLRGALERAGVNPEDFAQKDLKHYQREAWRDVLTGQETPHAGYLAYRVTIRISNASAIYQELADLLTKAYPIDFKPTLVIGRPNLGMEVVMVAPQGVDVMLLIEALGEGSGKLLNTVGVCPSPYLRYSGSSEGPFHWGFDPKVNVLPERAHYPIALKERPPEADKPYWFGKTATNDFSCATPEGAWTFKSDLL